MNPAYPKSFTFIFMAGYIFSYLSALWGVTMVFGEQLASSWMLLDAYAWKLKAISIIAPLPSVLAGTFAANVRMSSIDERGAHHFGPWRFFQVGWTSMLISNWGVHCLALRKFVPREIGEHWLAHIGLVRYNTCIFLVAPTVGFAGAIFAVVLGRAISEAQRA